MKKQTDQDSHINRIFSLLDCFSVQQPELGVREAARLLGISSSASGRLLAALRNEGVVIQYPESRSYSLGGRVIRWAGTYTATSDLNVHALPYMKRILNETNETVSLYVVEGNERVCVERLESRQNVRIVEMVGQRLKLYAGSGGRAILAFMEESEIERILQIAATEIDPEHAAEEIYQIRTQLQAVRQTGYAISHGEWLTEASGIASPILNDKGNPIGSVSISGPSQRFQDEAKLKEYANLLLNYMQKISNDLGFVSGNFSSPSK